MKKTEFLSLPITESATLDTIIEQMKARKNDVIYTFINPNSFYIAENNANYVRLLNEFDGIFPDGIGVVFGARIFGKKIPARLSFDTTSVAPHIFRYALENKLSIYIIGGKDGVAVKAAGIIKDLFPGLQIVGASSGYFASQTEAIGLIHANQAHIVICGMGAPKQEEFLLALRHSGWKGIGFTCGGYLDQLGVAYQYYPDWIDKLDIRFIYRLYREPGRLGKRYILDYRIFVTKVIKEIIHKILRTK